ncbi:MAG: hypothetical protein JNM25_11330 [Planctomycetes bacterium]|nr:hypothetical protein [Planctomycetota bacterium]
MSNRDRIEHLRAEAAAAAKQKAAAKAAKAAGPKTARAAASRKKAPAGGRVRIVWCVCDPSGKDVQQFPYAQEQEARAEAQRLCTETGRTHFVRQADVPVE